MWFDRHIEKSILSAVKSWLAALEQSGIIYRLPPLFMLIWATDLLNLPSFILLIRG